jgi:hypothetical protein
MVHGERDLPATVARRCRGPMEPDARIGERATIEQLTFSGETKMPAPAIAPVLSSSPPGGTRGAC